MAAEFYNVCVADSMFFGIVKNKSVTSKSARRMSSKQISKLPAPREHGQWRGLSKAEVQRQCRPL